jgi:hypothetical protein
MPQTQQFHKHWLYGVVFIKPTYRKDNQGTKPPHIGDFEWAEQDSNLRPPLCKRDSRVVHYVHYLQAGVILPMCPTRGSKNIHHVHYFHTVLPALQPVAAGMKQGEQVQFRVGDVRKLFTRDRTHFEDNRRLHFM